MTESGVAPLPVNPRHYRAPDETFEQYAHRNGYRTKHSTINLLTEAGSKQVAEEATMAGFDVEIIHGRDIGGDFTSRDDLVVRLKQQTKKPVDDLPVPTPSHPPTNAPEVLRQVPLAAEGEVIAPVILTPEATAVVDRVIARLNREDEEAAARHQEAVVNFEPEAIPNDPKAEILVRRANSNRRNRSTNRTSSRRTAESPSR